MRSVDELTRMSEPAWPTVQQWIREATHGVEVLPTDDRQRVEALFRLQVTNRSPMGAIVFETGGILVDDGWLRILGSGHPRLTRSIPSWNADKTFVGEGLPPPLLLVADDVLGGFFAINGGGLPGASGNVQYLGPDAFDWQDLELSYSQFLGFAFSGDLEGFYEGLRWAGWRAEIREVSGDRGLSVYPFLWAEGPSLAERSRRPVRISELWTLHRKIRAELGGAG